MKKDNDFLNYQKKMSDKVLKLTNKIIQLTELSQKSDTSASARAKESQSLSEPPPPPHKLEDKLDFDGPEPSIPPAQLQEEQNEQQQVKDKAHAESKSKTPDYKKNPVYPGMKKVLKDTNLSKRKYKMAKKQLQEDCERLLVKKRNFTSDCGHY